MFHPIRRALFSKQWLRDHHSNFYVRESRRLNYRSRAAFKLLQINQKHSILSGLVLDLGSAPGSWSQVASQLGCTVVALDLLPMKAIPNVTFIQGDIRDPLILDGLTHAGRRFDNIFSDMAPNFSGDHEADHQNILALNTLVLQIALKSLKPGGNLVMKTLTGSDEKNNFNECSKHFRQFFREKPDSSKKESTEIFYVGKHIINQQF